MTRFLTRLLESLLLEAKLDKLMVSTNFLELVEELDRYNNNLITPALKTLVQTKLADHAARASTSDSRFVRGSPLSEYSHVHIISGKIILIYKISGGALYLYTLVTHKDYDGGNAGRLARVLASYKFTEVPPDQFEGTENLEYLSNQDKEEVMTLIYELATSKTDRKILEQFLKGQPQNFMEFLEFAISMSDHHYDDHKKAFYNSFPDINVIMMNALKHVAPK